MTRPLRDTAAFLKEFSRQTAATGSLFPSSRFLAQSITRGLQKRSPAPVRILECGPGTGAFTDHIIRHLNPGDVLDLVEINSSFVELLHQRFQMEPRWKVVAHQTSIHVRTLQEFIPKEPYDFVISGLPHINFKIPILTEIVDRYRRLLKPRGQLSYFEYMYIRPIRRVATLGRDSGRIDQVDCLMNKLLADHNAWREDVFLNFPPAWVRHLVRNQRTPIEGAQPKAHEGLSGPGPK